MSSRAKYVGGAESCLPMPNILICQIHHMIDIFISQHQSSPCSLLHLKVPSTLLGMASQQV